jgi:hypothetical protein
MKRRFIFLGLLLCGLIARSQQLASNAVYRVTAEFPKYVTADVEFRDPSGARWPSFFYGRPATNGLIRLDAKPAAMFSLNCDQRPQKNGDQSRRVMGELFSTTNAGAVQLHVTAITGVKAAAENKGALSAVLTGSLEVLGKAVSVNALATLRPHSGKGDEKNEALMVELQFETKAGELGLKTFDASAPIQVRAALTAYSEAAITANATRRR